MVHVWNIWTHTYIGAALFFLPVVCMDQKKVWRLLYVSMYFKKYTFLITFSYVLAFWENQEFLCMVNYVLNGRVFLFVAYILSCQVRLVMWKRLITKIWPDRFEAFNQGKSFSSSCWRDFTFCITCPLFWSPKYDLWWSVRTPINVLKQQDWDATQKFLGHPVCSLELFSPYKMSHFQRALKSLLQKGLPFLTLRTFFQKLVRKTPYQEPILNEVKWRNASRLSRGCCFQLGFSDEYFNRYLLVSL